MFQRYTGSIKLSFPGIPMQKVELQPDEIYRYRPELQAAVGTVCKSTFFRTSAKSCQFLRFIVQRTLGGKVDELKERLIGIELLGREASYDTGSDAGVRVRANDVRKRLAAYYAATTTGLEYTVDIPTGSYVPRFYVSRLLQDGQSDPELPIVVEPPTPSHTLQQATELSLLQLALPTLVALFLCMICIRWQIAQVGPFDTFWQTVFQDHQALLYESPLASGGQPALIAVDRLEDTASLFNLAGQFHAGITLTHTLTPPSGTNGILILIGAIPSSPSESVADSPALDRISPVEGSRLVIEPTPSGRQIVDRNAGDTLVHPYGRAGLVTIVNSTQRSIHIDGTDDAAIDSLIKTMCEPNAFPDELIDIFKDGTVTQIVFPKQPSAQAAVFHESLPVTHMAINGPL
jgi:hypothetical protein